MRRFPSIAVYTIALLLAACSGMTGGGGSADGSAPGAAGGALDQVGGGNPGEPPPQIVAHATTEGVLGSQSSNVDMEPNFYREYALSFSGEGPSQGVGYNYGLVTSPGTLPSAQLKRLKSQLGLLQRLDCPECAGMWVRAVNCGAYDDEAILKLIPEEEKGNPAASVPLLWFLFHMPRPGDAPSVITCEGGKYMDLAVSAGGAVDLSKLELYPDEIVVFYPLDASPDADILPLSTQGYTQISKEKIVASNKHGMARFTRPSKLVLYMQPLYLPVNSDQ